jgi:hypothetical protein
LKFVDVSEVHTASIIIALMTEAVCTSEMLVNFNMTRSATSQKTLNFILTAMRNFTEILHIQRFIEY